MDDENCIGIQTQLKNSNIKYKLNIIKQITITCVFIHMKSCFRTVSRRFFSIATGLFVSTLNVFEKCKPFPLRSLVISLFFVERLLRDKCLRNDNETYYAHQLIMDHFVVFV